MIYDMTKGSPLKMILSFSVPMLIGNIFPISIGTENDTVLFGTYAYRKYISAGL